ncbi:unnamed protein product [Lymnaea stagnalis]|uniref:Uncharacterized protein n=1 Tax=Lymnaea stagnalis TaxID=6523 RepID=A0AAV2GZ62_LYMST
MDKGTELMFLLSLLLLTTDAVTTAPLKLIVSTVDQEPFITREPTAQGEKYSGYLVDLLNEVSRRAEFTYEFKQSSDGTIGANRPTGWTGVIGDVISGKADIGATALTVTPQREEVVDFTKPFMSNSVNLLVQKPTWTDLGLGYLVRPFSADYWIMILVVLLLIGIVFFIIGKFSPYEWGNVAADRDPRGAKNSFTLRNSYLFVLSTLTWQGWLLRPYNHFLFVLFCLNNRPEQMPNMPFRTYEELFESSDIRVGALSFGSTEYQLRTSRGTTLKALYNKISSQNTWVESYKEGVSRVKAAKGHFVMFMDSTSAEYFARHNCDLMIYGENLFPSSMAFAVKKGSVWRNKINDALVELQEEGFLTQLKDKYWRFSGACSNIDGRKFQETAGFLSTLPIYPVTLKDMAVAILLLFLGFIAAMVFLVIEIVHYAVTKKGKKIERPKILKNAPKIFRPKTKAAKASPTDVELGEEAGPSSDGLESVPLEDAEEPGASSGDELRGEEAQKA